MARADNRRRAGVRLPWFEIRNQDAADEPVEILIYDQIGRDWFDDSGVEAQTFAEALQAIPRERDIVVGINSPGGNVWDGLAIYNLIRMRSDRVTTRVDGVALSIASVIALAGSEVVMPANALIMIHDPSGLVMGTSAAMRQMAEHLDAHADVLADVYAARAGGTRCHWRRLMQAETWFNGVEARDAGLADTVSDEVQLEARFDFSPFRHVPEPLQQQQPQPPASGPASPGASQPMNRQQILSLLRRHGITVAANATNAQLLRLLDRLPESAAAQRAQALEYLTGQPAAHRRPGRRAVPPGAPHGIAPADPADPADPDPDNPNPDSDDPADSTPALPADPAGPADANAAPAQPGARRRQAVPQARAGDADVAELRQQLQREREMRVSAALDAIIEDRPYLAPDRDSWLARAMNDEAILDSLRAMPIPQTGTDPVRGRVLNLGNPLLERYGAMRAGADRQRFRLDNFEAIRAARMDFHRGRGPQAANTLAAALVTDWLADGLVIVANNRLSALQAFSRDFGTDPLKPRATVQVRKASAAGTAQDNPTNFETGDSTVDAIGVTVNQVSRSFHITNNEMQSGHRLIDLARKNAHSFVNALSDDWTALLIAANYATPLVIGAATDFDSADLRPIMAAAKNFTSKNLVLDGGHLAYLLPTDREKFRIGEAGAYGFDLMTEQNRWTGAVANTAGFVCSPDAISLASGLPIDVPDGEFLEKSTVLMPELGLTVSTCTWYSRAGRVIWASYDVMFGAAVGDATQAEILVTV